MLYDATIKSALYSAKYYAPRGQKRLYLLGSLLAQRYLRPSDLVIGIIGAEGAGKSTLIRGLFPGLELTNDDDGVNNRLTPIFNFSPENFFSGHTFHLDVRYEAAFHQMHEIVAAINKAIDHQRRVVIEHFDLVYSHLGYNAQIIFAIGDDVRVYRPSVFGPSPLKIKQEVDATIKYRLMAHSAEDITIHILNRDYGYEPPDLHSDIKHGFVIGFVEKPKIDINELENKVKKLIRRNVKINVAEGNFIEVDGEKIVCTGKRIHVKSSGEIQNFRLVKKFCFDPLTKEYLLVGVVGEEHFDFFETLPPKDDNPAKK